MFVGYAANYIKYLTKYSNINEFTVINELYVFNKLNYVKLNDMAQVQSYNMLYGAVQQL